MRSEFFKFSVIILFVLGSAQPSRLVAQEKDSNYIESSKWVSEVLGTDGKTAFRIGEFDSYSDAEAASRKWSQSHPNDNSPTVEREIKTRQLIVKPRTPP